MKWIMPALIFLCTIFVIAISVWRIDSVVLEKKTLEAEIDESFYKWVENYYMEMDALVQIFYSPDYLEDDYQSFFAETYEERLEFWHDFSLLPRSFRGLR